MGFLLQNKSFTKKSINEGYKFLDSLNPPYVLKADGLAAGKGVLIIDKLMDAKKQLNSMLKKGLEPHLQL